MRTLWIAALFGCALAGCQSPGAVTITQNDVDAARSAYDAAFLAPAAAYRGLPLCAAGQPASLANPCANAATIEKLQAADKQVEAAFDALQTLVSEGDEQSLTSQYQALTSAIGAAESLVSTLGAN